MSGLIFTLAERYRAVAPRPRWEVVAQSAGRADRRMRTHLTVVVAEAWRLWYERQDQDRVEGVHYTVRRIGAVRPAAHRRKEIAA